MAFAFFRMGTVDNSILEWIITHIGLLGTSYFPYMIGMCFARKQIITVLKQSTKQFDKYIPYCFAIILIGMIIMHSIIQSLFVAVFTAVVTICLFCICPLPKKITMMLIYLGEHSTNIWLVHMFFYTGLFDKLVFYAKYPVSIFVFLLLLSLGASYIINLICKPVLKLVR